MSANKITMKMFEEDAALERLLSLGLIEYVTDDEGNQGYRARQDITITIKEEATT